MRRRKAEYAETRGARKTKGAGAEGRAGSASETTGTGARGVPDAAAEIGGSEGASGSEGSGSAAESGKGETHKGI